jgi:hypothetical protein
VRRNESDGTLFWGALGAGVGLLAGFALGEWVGDVNRPRLRRAAQRLQAPAPTRLTAAAGARAAAAALAAEPALADYRLDALAIGAGAVELRGWVASRAARALAARRVRAVPGIESVTNSILVRGEDDLRTADTEASDQSA